MLSAPILATILHARAEHITRAVIWGMMHDHPAIVFDRCVRKYKRLKCKRERDDANLDACRFILKGQCEI